MLDGCYSTSLFSQHNSISQAHDKRIMLLLDDDGNDLVDTPSPPADTPSSALDGMLPSLPPLATFLATAGLDQHAVALEKTSVAFLLGCNFASRTTVLKHLTTLGIDKLADRQKVANALGKAVRAGSLPQLSTAQVLVAAAQPLQDAEDAPAFVLAPPDVNAQQSTALAPQAIPRILHQTNKTRCVGMNAWRNVCRTFEHNPGYSYRFYDDARCEELIRDNFHSDVLVAFQTLRAGAAIADLWRYCCLYVHGGVYLDLDSGVIGPLDNSQAAKGDLADPPIGPQSQALFMIDAEANLIQWALAAVPRHPVLLRCIEMSVQRILQREPNIFIATGPSVFTDAFIASHGKDAVYASRTAMDWSTRLNFLQKHGAVSEAYGIFRCVYDGYEHSDVYIGAEERYLPTWGSEPTHRLYHPVPLQQLPEMNSSTTSTRGSLAGRYLWSGSDVIESDGGTVHWRCTLTLGDEPKARPPEITVNVLPAPADLTAVGAQKEAQEGNRRPVVPYPAATFRFERTRVTPDGRKDTDESGELRGVWRRAPGKSDQLHLFEWTPQPSATSPRMPSIPPQPVEAPSVLHLMADYQNLELVGWQGDGKSEDGLSERLRLARRRPACNSPLALHLPILFAKAADGADGPPADIA